MTEKGGSELIATEHQPRSFDSDIPVTIVIPTHNRPELLKNCLSSLEAQDHRDFEVIIANTGKEVELPLSVLTRRNIRVVRVAKDNLACAYNTGISLASSSIVCFVDDDVTMPPSWLRYLVELIRRNPTAAAWAGPAVELGKRRTRELVKTGSLFTRVGMRLYNLVLMAGRASQAAYISECGAVSLGTVEPLDGTRSDESAIRVTAPSNANLAVRREVLVDLGGFDERFNFSYQEGDLYLRFRDEGLPIIMGRKPYLFHHISGSGETRRIEPHSRDFDVFLRVIRSRHPGFVLFIRHWFFRASFVVTFLATSRGESLSALREILRGFARGRREFVADPKLPFRSISVAGSLLPP